MGPSEVDLQSNFRVSSAISPSPMMRFNVGAVLGMSNDYVSFKRTDGTILKWVIQTNKSSIHGRITGRWK
jgi:hypothetical protein